MLVTATLLHRAMHSRHAPATQPLNRGASLSGRTVRDVAGPYPVGCRHRKLTIERVGGHGMLVGRTRGGPPLLDRLGADGVRTPEPGDPMFPNLLALSQECRVKAGAPLRAP